ncbi:hypothetical protein ACRYCC_12305 [Actinomadura scrupuli]|uniref:hypothetical protein n=1 Tax=Actinomadura scrupuli TaxID=559629 RepID=UPI003D98F53D
MRVRFERPVGGLALVALSAALLTGCGAAKTGDGTFHPSGGDTATSEVDPAASSPSAPAPSAMTTPDYTKAVLDGYRAYQAAYQRAYEAGDPSELDGVATNPLLAAVTKDVRQTIGRRLVYRFALQLNPRVQTWRADRTEAVVIDCVRTVNWYAFSVRTGKRIASGSNKPTTRLSRYAMRYDPGSRTWRAYTQEGGSKC